MASKLEFVEYIAEQLSGAGEIKYRKMFGEYGLYCNGKYFAGICDNQLFVKITKAGEKYSLPKKPPYDGAKDSFLVENIDDAEFLTRLALDTVNELPEPKPKVPKKKKSEKTK